MNHLSMGRLYCKLLDFEKAEKVAEEGLAEAEKAGDWAMWGRLAALCMRVYLDTMQTAKAAELKVKLLSFREKNIPELASSIDYYLGMQAAESANFEEAELFFCSSVKKALDDDDRNRARFGLAVIPQLQGLPEKAIQILDKMQPPLDEADSLSTRFSTACLREALCAQLGLYDQQKAFLQTARDIAREDQNPSYVVHCLISEAYAAFYAHDFENSKRHIETAERLLPKSAKTNQLSRLEGLKSKIREAEIRPLIEIRNEGLRKVLQVGAAEPVDVTKLEILTKLLTVLGDQFGAWVEKEEICRELWDEEYHPIRHDNKIYVTVRRLRHLLEDSGDRPEIVLMKDGRYLLNPKFRFSRFQPETVEATSHQKYKDIVSQSKPNSLKKEGRL